MFGAFRSLVTRCGHLALEPTITGILYGLLDASRAHIRLQAPLYGAMGAAQGTRCHARALDAYIDVVAGVLGARTDVTVDDPRAAATLVVNAGDGVIRSLVTQGDPVAADLLIREGVRMICRYLTPSQMRSARA